MLLVEQAREEMDEKHGCLDFGLNLAIGFSGIDIFFFSKKNLQRIFQHVHINYWEKWMKKMDVKFRVIAKW